MGREEGGFGGVEGCVEGESAVGGMAGCEGYGVAAKKL